LAGHNAYTLKKIGNGKVWLIATAQQTLTEDNPNARLNSDKLYTDSMPRISHSILILKLQTSKRSLQNVYWVNLLNGAAELKALYDVKTWRNAASLSTQIDKWVLNELYIKLEIR
jgi:hypothetical protein